MDPQGVAYGNIGQPRNNKEVSEKFTKNDYKQGKNIFLLIC